MLKKLNNNLFIRTGYSILESMLKISDIIDYALENDFSHIGIIEKDFLHSSHEFYKATISKKLKPIIGLEFSTTKDIAVALNTEGYYELVKLSSLYQSDFALFENEIRTKKSSKNLKWYINKNFKFGSYKNIEDKKTFEIFLKITSETNQIKDTQINLQDEVNLEQKQIIKEINNLNISISIEPINFLQSIDFFDGRAQDILREKSFNNLDKRKFEYEVKIEDYKQRLEHELKVINSMNFSSYFLIVEDYVAFALSNDIYVGPGRGSAPGSLVSFLLNITSIDPIKNNLIFERFLNPSRVSLPDIDIDFQDDKRQEIVNYLIKKYGRENISQIITFQTFQTKNTIKDVAKIYGIDFKTTNSFTKLFDEYNSFEKNLRTKKVKDFIKENPSFDSIVKHSIKIIDLPRQTSTHAAGVLISKKPIYNFIPTMTNHTNKQNLSQLSMNYLEENGLIKFDLLGLKILSTLKHIYEIIKKTKNKTLSIDLVKLNDESVFKNLSEGKTQGIFQLESKGMTEAIKKIKIKNFEDIVSVISLYRPGPMKNIDLFAERKNSKTFSIPFDSNPILEKILSRTYGIIVYQEQILEIANLFAGLTLTEADNLRRAISKKDEQNIKSFKEMFIDGSVEKGADKNIASEVYELIHKFANYGFNRSHAFSYAIVSYNFAYLKNYFPQEFAASYLSSVDGEINKITSYLEENPELVILGPSLKHSFSKFSLEKTGIRLGFSILKGIGIEAVSKILSAKEKIHSNTNIFEAIVILTSSGVSNKMLEVLIKVGALDEWNFSRESLLESYESIVDLNKVVQTKNGSIDLTILDEDDLPIINKIKDKNNHLYEKEFIGFSIKKLNI